MLAALLAVPFAALGLFSQPNASEVKPLVGAVLVVTCYHITIGDILAEAIERFSDPTRVSYSDLLLLLKVAIAKTMLILLSCLRCLASKGSEKLLILLVRDRLDIHIKRVDIICKLRHLVFLIIT